MKILLLPMGSHGDVHPFVGLGQRLRERGHEVIVINAEPFRDLIERSGLGYHQIGTAEEFERLQNHPDLWHPRKAFPYIAREGIVPGMQRQYEAIMSLYEPGRTVLVGSALGFGVRIAHERWNIPFASLHLQPSVMWSEYQSPLLARGALLQDWVPRWVKRGQHWMMNKLINGVLLKPVNAYRGEVGIAPLRYAWDMMHSPMRIVCMFPEWYAPAQPDWPPGVVHTGFPLWDEKGVTEVPAEVEEFLESGSPPIAFTPGSAMTLGESFFRAAVEACEKLGRRGMLLTRHERQLPKQLPAGVRHFAYVPFSHVLPRCAALVYHGGIGTCSQALAAGVPHVIMPMAHDQPDNAARIHRLGVGATLWPGNFRGSKLAAVLDRLLNSADVARNCREVAARFAGVDGLGRAATAVEELGSYLESPDSRREVSAR